VAYYEDIFLLNRVGTETFVMVSMDIAVSSNNVIDALNVKTELIIQNTSKLSDTKFVVVRFGNVLGCLGSVKAN